MTTGFTCEKESKLIYKFVFCNKFTDEDFRKFLGVLTKFLELNKPFSFYVDASMANVAPINASINLIKWMINSKPIIKKNKKFIGGCVVIKNETLSSLLAAVFKIQKPICPVKITTDMDSAKKFMKEITDNYVKNNGITLVDENNSDAVTQLN